MGDSVKVLSFFGAKHGVGTTTIATLVACIDSTRLLIAHDVDDVIALLGRRGWTDDDRVVNDLSNVGYVPGAQTLLAFANEMLVPEAELRTARHSIGAEIAVMDWGVEIPTFGTPIMVTDNSYVSLRRAVKITVEYQNVVLVRDPVRALMATDVEHALGRPVITLNRDPALMRSCDAGLLTARQPLHITRPLDALTLETSSC